MMKNTQYKKNCISHVIARFEERFKKEDFIYEDSWGEKIDLKEHIASSIANAPKMGKSVKGGKGYRTIFKVKAMDTKTVFVVWDMEFSIPVTVLTTEMWSKFYG